MKTPSQKKHQNVTNQSIRNITDNNKCQRQLDILRIKDPAELSVDKAYVHHDHGIKSQKTSEKDIAQKSAGKSNQKPLSLSSHEAERRRQNDHQIGNNPAKRQAVEHTALQNKEQKDQKYYNDLAQKAAVILHRCLLPEPAVSYP